MIRRFALLVSICAVLFASPVLADGRGDAKAWVSFGIDVAQRGLWREAIYRWEKATQFDPTYAPAFNNLAIGYEHEGQMDKAREAYERAVALAPKDSQIRQNYEQFREINDRSNAEKDTP